MSSATHDSGTNQFNGEEVRSGSSKNEQRAGRPAHGQRQGPPPTRRGRNVRPLPVTPPPRVGGDDEQPNAPHRGFASPANPGSAKSNAEIEIQTRRPVTALRRSSRARGVGTITTLIMGMILVIVLAVALIMVLIDDDPATNATGPVAKNGINLKANSSQAPTADNKQQNATPPSLGNSTKDTAQSNTAADAVEQSDNASPIPINEPPAKRGFGNPALRDSGPGGQTNDIDDDPPPLDAATLAGLPTLHIMDDGDARLTGDWNVADRNRQEHAGARYHGEGFRIDNGTFGELATAQYIFPAMRPGKYLVSISYPEAPNRASNVKVVVLDANGKHEVVVDQSEPPERGKFLEIGEYTIDPWKPLVVRFSNEGVFGYLAIDAVKAENLDVQVGDDSGNSSDGGDK